MTTRISISEDGIWAGSGTVEGGRIEDCAAVLGEDVYTAIEQDVERSSVDNGTVTIGGVRYDWTTSEGDRS